MSRELLLRATTTFRGCHPIDPPEQNALYEVALGNHSGSLEIASSLSTSGREPELSMYCQVAMLAAHPGSSGEYSGAFALVNLPIREGSKLQRYAVMAISGRSPTARHHADANSVPVVPLP
mgnify:CR=1 FL=1